MVPGFGTALREPDPPTPARLRLLDRVRAELRTRHYSRRTEKAYVGWIRRYILFHGKRHPSEMGASEITAFLSALAIRDTAAASTQNQALSALLFLYRDVLGLEVPWLDEVVRAKRPHHLPVVLTRDEVRGVINRLTGPSRLMALLLYGAGLRLLECAHLRVKDNRLRAEPDRRGERQGRPGDRMTMLPGVVKTDLAASFDVAILHTVLTHVPGPEAVLAEAFRVLRPDGWLGVCDGDFSTATLSTGDLDPLEVCVHAFVEGFVNDRWMVRRMSRLAADAGFEVSPLRSYGLVETMKPGLTLTWVDRGADVLAGRGRISQEFAAALKAEAKRRAEAHTFCGYMAYASMIGRKPR